jgi:hypothetical protein
MQKCKIGAQAMVLVIDWALAVFIRLHTGMRKRRSMIVGSVLVTVLFSSCTKMPTEDPIVIARLVAENNGRTYVLSICREMLDRPVKSDAQLEETVKAPHLVQTLVVPSDVYRELRIQVSTVLNRWKSPEGGPVPKGVLRVECIDKQGKVKDTFVFDSLGRLLGGNPKIEDGVDGTVEFSVKAMP